MNLTFQVLMQYCSLQHQNLLSPPDTSTAGHSFCFGLASSFLLDLFLHSSAVAYWIPRDLGGSSFSVIYFYMFTGFSRQEYWSGLPFPSPVNHILLELATMNPLSWVTLHGMAYSLIELGKAVVHVISLVSFLWLWFSFCPLMDERHVEASWWERYLKISFDVTKYPL